MRLFAGALAAAMLALAPVTGAVAKAPLSKAEISSALASQGYTINDIAPDRFAVQVQDLSVLVWIDGPDGDISFITWLPRLSSKQVSYEFITKFNSEVKFGRAYVDRDGDITLQMDRNASGGATVQNIQSDFDVFLVLIAKFLTDLEARASA